MGLRASWFGVAVALCGALSCGGRAEQEAARPSGESGASSSNGGASSAGDGAGGLHSVFVACELCGFAELTCTGAQFPESQSTFRQNLTVDSCDFEPAAGLEGSQFHVDCKDGTTNVRCTLGYCNAIVYADGVLGEENLDGSFAFTCRGPSGVK